MNITQIRQTVHVCRPPRGSRRFLWIGLAIIAVAAIVAVAGIVWAVNV